MCLTASLFNFENPGIEIGRLKSSLIIRNNKESEGYVLNVLYSYSSILHNGDLTIPYAVSNLASTYAPVNLKELLTELKISKNKS